MGCFEKFWDVEGYFRIFWDVSGHFGMFWDVFGRVFLHFFGVDVL